MTLEEVLRKTLKDLSDSGADCAVVGGLAVSVRVDPRFTRDVDLAVAQGHRKVIARSSVRTLQK